MGDFLPHIKWCYKERTYKFKATNHSGCSNTVVIGIMARNAVCLRLI
nr:MAG TPA: hypothetical protein [Caudoviricetes sp.]